MMWLKGNSPAIAQLEKCFPDMALGFGLQQLREHKIHLENGSMGQWDPRGSGIHGALFPAWAAAHPFRSLQSLHGGPMATALTEAVTPEKG